VKEILDWKSKTPIFEFEFRFLYLKLGLVWMALLNKIGIISQLKASVLHHLFN